MNAFSSLIMHYGYLVIFLIVFAEAIGVPVPGAVALVAGGAAVAAGTLSGPAVVLCAVAAMLSADSLLYLLGRHMGWTILRFLCQVAVDPEGCVLRSAESFYKRGRLTLLFDKFIPGVSTMAAPLAGSMKMRFSQFLGLDFLGASLYALSYGAIGFISRGQDRQWISRSRTRGRDCNHHCPDCVYRLPDVVVLAATRRSACTTRRGTDIGCKAADRRPGKDTAGRCA